MRASEVLAIILSDEESVTAPSEAQPKEDFVALWKRAMKAGDAAMVKCVPTPMIVQQRANPLNDRSAVVTEWVVEGGVCGFASIHVKAKGKGLAFIRALKKAGLCADKKSAYSVRDHRDWQYHGYYGGFYYHVWQGSQSLALKEAWARAAAEVLQSAGIDAFVRSNMD